MKLDPVFFAVAAGLAIPLVRSIATKSTASQWLKTFVGVALSCATGVLAQVQSQGGIVTKQAVLGAVLAFVVAQGSHYGLWDPTGATVALDAITARFGLGRSAPTTRQLPSVVVEQWTPGLGDPTATLNGGLTSVTNAISVPNDTFVPQHMSAGDEPLEVLPILDDSKDA